MKKTPYLIGVIEGIGDTFMVSANKKFENTSILLTYYREGGNYDAIVICKNATFPSHVSCNTVVAPENTPVSFTARYNISYGMSMQDTLTVSSISSDNIDGENGKTIVALRQDITSFTGKPIGIAEFTFNWTMHAYTLLPIAALLILAEEV